MKNLSSNMISTAIAILLFVFVSVLIFVLSAFPTNHCPYCGREVEIETYDFNYCPNCGRKIDTVWVYNIYQKPENRLFERVKK